MSERSSIEWTDATWNPVRGCSRVSTACDNCYAIREGARHAGTHRTTYKERLPPKPGPYAGFVKRKGDRMDWTGKVALIQEKLVEPLLWKRPRRIFVNSMSDLFHESLPFEAIAAVFGVMASERRHTFQVLTKRPERMLRFFERLARDPDPWAECHWQALTVERERGGGDGGPIHCGGQEVDKDEGRLWPLPNVWLGVSVEDQQRADERIPLLLRTPAAIRFVSYEPALGPVNFRPYLVGWEAETIFDPDHPEANGHRTSSPGLDWLIVGGESGPGARPMDLDWARSARDQCREAGVACFVKQIGSRWARMHEIEPAGGVRRFRRSADRKGGDPSEWPEDLRVREFPSRPAAVDAGDIPTALTRSR